MNTKQNVSATLTGGLVVTVFGMGLLGYAALFGELDTSSLLEGGFAIVLGLGLLASGLLQRAGHAAFAQTSLEVTGPVRLGGVVEAVLVLDVTAPVPLDPAGCTATLHSLETCWEPSGRSSRRKVTHEVYAEARALELPGVLEAPVQLRFSFTVPPSAPPSWEGKEHAFLTEVVVKVALVGRADVALVAPVTVLPELAW